MKFLFSLSVVVIAAFIFFSFFGNLNQPINLSEDGKPSSSAPTYNNQPQLEKNPARVGSSTPPGFKGPTGQPHIIGPSGPPPDY